MEVEAKTYIISNVTKEETARIQAMGWEVTEWCKIWDISPDSYQRYTNPEKRTDKQHRVMLMNLRHTPKKTSQAMTVEKAQSLILKRLNPSPAYSK